MLNIHPQFIKDNHGQNSLVILPIKEFDNLIEELESMEDVKLYDQAKKEDTGERIIFSEYLKNRKRMSNYQIVLSRKAQK